MRNLNRVFVGILVSMFLSISGVISAQAVPLGTAPNGDTNNEIVTIDHGHIDIFHVTSTGTGNLVLQMADDTAGPRLLRTPESAILQVNSDRWYAPEDIGTFAQIVGNKPAAILPLAQQNNSLWPGWDVMDLKGKYTAIDIVFDEVIGPKGGQLYLVGGARGLSDDYQDYMHRSENAEKTKFKVLPGKFIRDEHLSHTHVYWAFTKPGIYQFKAHIREADPEKMKNGSCVKTRVATYSWRVLDAHGKLPDDFEMVNYGTPIEDETCTVESTSGSEASIIGSEKTPEKADLFGKSYLNSPDEINPNHGVENNAIGSEKTPEKGEVFSEDYLNPLYQTVSKLQKEIYGINQQIADCQAGITCTVNTRSSGQSSRNTSTNDAHRAVSTRVASPNVGAGVYDIPINTHVHPNWVFTAPGTYKVVIRQTAVLKTGKVVSADAPLTFYVGGSGNANSGHYDLGADMRNGKFVALIRDDSRSPARYVSPDSLTFGLGSASRETAPAGIGFIASEGSTIYRIPEVQKTGVPWLGANTMNSGVLSNVASSVRWSIASFSGPGHMAMFSGGGFDGKYRVWLNTRGIKKGDSGSSKKAKVIKTQSLPTTTDSESTEIEIVEEDVEPTTTLLDTQDAFLGKTVLASGINTYAAIGIFVGGMVILISAIVVVLKLRA